MTGRLRDPQIPILRHDRRAERHRLRSFGATSSQLPVQAGVATLGSATTAYRTDAASEKGVWLSTSYERRHFTVASDLAATWGTTSGIDGARSPGRTSAIVVLKAPAYHGLREIAADRPAMRVGVRAPMGRIALAAEAPGSA